MSQTGENGTDDPGKMFVGGLSWTTTAENLKNYFAPYGDVEECLVMYDRVTMRSRGYGYIKFKEAASVAQVMRTRPHIVDGKQIDPKPCCPRGMEKMIKQCKVFLGGLPLDADEQAVKDFFEGFGKVVEAQVMYNVDKKRSRGFGFVAFENESVVNQLLEQRYVDFNGKQVEIRRLETSAARRARAQQQQAAAADMGGYYGGQGPRGGPMGGPGYNMYDGRGMQMGGGPQQWGYPAQYGPPGPTGAKWAGPAMQPGPQSLQPGAMYPNAAQWNAQSMAQWNAGFPQSGGQTSGGYAQFGGTGPYAQMAAAAQQGGPANQPWTTQQSGAGQQTRAYGSGGQQAQQAGSTSAQWGFSGQFSSGAQMQQAGWNASGFQQNAAATAWQNPQGSGGAQGRKAAAPQGF